MTASSLRWGPFSLRLRGRVVLTNLGLCALIILIMGIGITTGSYPVDVAGIVRVLLAEGDDVLAMIVVDNRLPRLLTALGVGLAFGLAGEMIQTLLRNPLASPDVIGFSAGASVGAIATIVLTGTTWFILPGAVSGGIAAAALVLLLSWDRGLAAGGIVLIGIGVGLTLTVVSNLLMVRIDASSAADVAKWLVGSLNSRSWTDVGTVWIGLLILAPLAFWQQFALGRLIFQDDVAIGLGVPLNWHRITVVTIAIGLVAIAVAAAGPLPFVAFVAGPIAHGLNGATRPTLLSAALVGAVVTLLADLVARSALGGSALPSGVFTALVGAPVLLWVLLAQARKQRL